MYHDPKVTNEVGMIGYLLEDFLTPTTTFITQEARFLLDNGYNVQAYVVGKPIKPSDTDPAVADLLRIAQFSRPLNAKGMVLSHFDAVFRFPIKYARTLCRILQKTWYDPGQCIRSLRYFMDGIYFGRKMLNERVRWLHVHFAGRAATAAWSIRSVYGIPYSVTTHAYDLFADDGKRRADKGAKSIPTAKRFPSFLNLKLQDAQAIVTISEFNRKFLTEQLKIQTDKISVVRCSVDTARFARRALPRHQLPVILSVGRLIEKKGHDILLQACAQLKALGYQFSCKIIGTGPLLQPLTALRDALCLKEYVEFCGCVHHSNIAKYYDDADVFALACVKGTNGDMDGIPVSLMEAMAMEIPVVTTNLSGIPELVETGITGFVVTPGDSNALAEKLRQLLDDSDLRQRMGEAARQRIFDKYDQAKNHSLMLDILVNGLTKPALINVYKDIRVT